MAKKKQSKMSKNNEEIEKTYWESNNNEQEELERPFLGLRRSEFLFYVRPWEHDELEVEGALAYIGSGGNQSRSMNRTGFAFDNRKMRGDEMFEGKRVAITDISASVGQGRIIDVVGRGKSIYVAKDYNGGHKLVYIARGIKEEQECATPESRYKSTPRSKIENFTSYSLKKFERVHKLLMLDNFLIIQKNKIDLEVVETAKVKLYARSLSESNKTSNGFRNRDEKTTHQLSKVDGHQFSIENGIKKITSGREHCVILTETQELFGFGANRYNELSPDSPEETDSSSVLTNKESTKVHKMEGTGFQFQQLNAFDYEVIENVYCGGYLTLIQTRKGSIQLMGRLNKQTQFKYAREVKIESGDFNPIDPGFFMIYTF